MRRLHSHEWEHLIQTKDDEIAQLTKRVEGYRAVLRMTTTESEQKFRDELSDALLEMEGFKARLEDTVVQNAQLRGSLRLADDAVSARDQTIKDLGFQLDMAEEGLANYAQELGELRKDHDQYVEWASPQLERLGREMAKNERLRITLKGVSACSTCEMCQGAALATLRHRPQSALLCTNCGKPLDDHGGAGLPCPT